MRRRRDPYPRALSRRSAHGDESVRRGIPAQCPGRGRLAAVPLGRGPSLHSLRRGQALFVRPLLGYYDPVRILIPVHFHRSAVAFLNRPGLAVRTRMRLPRFRAKNFSTCTRPPTGRASSHARHSPWDDVASSSTEGDRHLGIRPVSQLNTWPVVSPVNASRRPSRDAAHHSGSGRMAKPFPWGAFTSSSFTAFLPLSELGQTRHFDRAPITSGLPLPAQPVDATQALNLSAGVSNCKVSRGRSFS